MDKITIHINRPDIDFSSEKAKQKSIKELTAMITDEIVAELFKQKQDETVAYWNKRLRKWEVESLKTDIRMNKIKQQMESDKDGD